MVNGYQFGLIMIALNPLVIKLNEWKNQRKQLEIYYPDHVCLLISHYLTQKVFRSSVTENIAPLFIIKRWVLDDFVIIFFDVPSKPHVVVFDLKCWFSFQNCTNFSQRPKREYFNSQMNSRWFGKHEFIRWEVRKFRLKWQVLAVDTKNFSSNTL